MQQLIGRSVINVHRTQPGVTPRTGTIVGFASGVNGGTRVRWPAHASKDPDYEVEMVTNDLALVEDWPKRNADNTTEYIRLSSYALTPTL